MQKDFIVKKHFPKNREYNLRLSTHNIPTSNYLTKCVLRLTRWIAHLYKGWQLITAICHIYSLSLSHRYPTVQLIRRLTLSTMWIIFRILLIWKLYYYCTICFHWKDWKLKNKKDVKSYLKDMLLFSKQIFGKGRKGRTKCGSCVALDLAPYYFTNLFKRRQTC